LRKQWLIHDEKNGLFNIWRDVQSGETQWTLPDIRGEGDVGVRKAGVPDAIQTICAKYFPQVPTQMHAQTHADRRINFVLPNFNEFTQYD
jgi:hypothetical protein